MSIVRAVSNAASGLRAIATGTETVAANIANASTPGYGRREVALAPDSIGGVGIIGINRSIKAGVLAELRSANSAVAADTVTFDFHSSLEKSVGLPGEPAALSTAVTNLRTALSHAAARPDDNLRLGTAIAAADKLAVKLNRISDDIHQQRALSEQRIQSDVELLNRNLARVSELNRSISKTMANGGNASSLLDARQAALDEISSVVAINEVARGNGTAAIFTKDGATLLDGNTPAMLSFTPSAGAGAAIAIDGAQASTRQFMMLSGGSLAANFVVRDQLVPGMQTELDGLKNELYSLTARPEVDPTLSGRQAGLFVIDDQSGAAGGSIRISVNPVVTTDPWKLRDGVGALEQGPVGNPSTLAAIARALEGGYTTTGTGFHQRVADLEAGISTMRVVSDQAKTESSARLESAQLLSATDAVDVDVETQLLLQFERAFAANARVLQAVDEMMASILRI